MARRLRNRLSQTFPMRAVITLDADDLAGKDTQQHLVGALRQLGAKNVHDLDDAAELFTRLQRLVTKQPVMLVVDNVWTAAQLDNLLPRSFHPGSRLIITSRFNELRHSGCYQVSAWWCVGVSSRLSALHGRAAWEVPPLGGTPPLYNAPAVPPLALTAGLSDKARDPAAAALER